MYRATYKYAVIHSAQYGFHQRPALHGRRARENENAQHQYDSKKLFVEMNKKIIILIS